MTGTAAPERPKPDDRCPKCGDPFGFLWARPQFVRAERYAEGQYSQVERQAPRWRTLGHLRWECSTCGYQTLTPTFDDALPPVEDVRWGDQA